MTPLRRTDPAGVSCDVLVVGGGAAGVAAATAAARAGARVVLLERYGFLGGLATVSQVGTVCGLYLRDTARRQPTSVAGGFAQEFADRLEHAAGRKPIRLDAGLWVLPYSTPCFAQVSDAVLQEAGNVALVLHATLAHAVAEDARLVQLQALAWNEPLSIRPATVVDCTGEATAAALAGDGVEAGLADQAPALVFCLEEVDYSLTDRGLLELRLELRRAVEQGLLPAVCERLSLVPGTGGDNRLILKLNLQLPEFVQPPWQQVTDWERQSRALVHQLHRFLVANCASCRNARIHSIAPQLGTRSGRRIRGRVRLTDEQVLRCHKSETGIARGCWPMERWAAGLKPEMVYLPERDFFEIPLDCLRSLGLDNVLVAGRCFSAAAGAMTSARVIGTALATGWAAGTAAAFQAAGRPLAEAVAVVRQQMAR